MKSLVGISDRSDSLGITRKTLCLVWTHEQNTYIHTLAVHGECKTIYPNKFYKIFFL
jgi:hypothetical protein